jgi:hypothetical protein
MHSRPFAMFPDLSRFSAGAAARSGFLSYHIQAWERRAGGGKTEKKVAFS